MANIKSAEKRIKVTRVKTERNKAQESALKTAIKKFRAKPTAEGLSTVVSLVDKAAQDNIYHSNKADRIKAKLTGMVKPAK